MSHSEEDVSSVLNVTGDGVELSIDAGPHEQLDNVDRQIDRYVIEMQQTNTLQPLVTSKEQANNLTIEIVLSIFSKIDSEWLWPRSTYSLEVLLDYIADHIDQIPQANPPDAASVSTHSNHSFAYPVYPPCNDTNPNLAAAMAVSLNQFNVSNAGAASLPADPLNTSTEERAHQSIINALNRSAVIRHNNGNEDHDNKEFEIKKKRRKIEDARQMTAVILAAQKKLYETVVKEILSSKYEDVVLDQDRREELLQGLKKNFRTVHEEFLQQLIKWFPPVACFLVGYLIENGMQEYLLVKDDARLHQLWDLNTHNEDGERKDFIYWVPDWLKADWLHYKSIIDKDYTLEVSEFDCPVCFEQYPIAKGLTCSNVYEQADIEAMDGLIQGDGHRICIDCVVGMAEAAVSDAQVAKGGTGLKCVDMECEGAIVFAHVSPLLDEETRNRLLKRLQQEALVSMSGLESCKKCQFTAEMIVSKEIEKLFMCPECNARFCRCCKLDWDKHVNSEGIAQRCEDVLSPDDFARIKLEEQLSNAILRQCVCGAQFVKESGCNKMTCRCGKTMCYICRMQGIGYEHFRNNGACALHVNHAEIDQRNLEAVRSNAKQDPILREILKNYN
ncbi:hypothetical protein WR25_07818 [Diploscapter pachys]|uniref:RING-type domain-containing protein n=1 Tax=Diploscapter pachys TaxID=2018661 RepID=A0A2A2LDN9_9BILA|nr:hypothetical protein WR25_07818 [Diploscapter pachys]